MNKLNSLFANLFLSLLACLLVFIFLETASRIYINNFAGEENFKKYASIEQIHNKKNKLKFTPHPYLRYIPTPNYTSGMNKHNSLGYRGDEIEIPKPEGRFRIICIGGSTTYESDIDNYRMSYPYLLEKILKENGWHNVDVVNAGVGGWLSWESLINFELRVLDLAPDMIVIYDALNDVHARFVWPPSAYKGDNTGEIYTTSYITMPGIFEYSTLLRILMINAGIIDSHSALERFGRADDSKITHYAPLFLKQKATNTYPEGIFKEVSAKKMLLTNKPIYFKRNISNIVSIAKDRDITTILVSFAYSPLFINEPVVSSEEYIFAYNEMNTVIRDIAEEMGVNFFDFANYFPKDKRYYSDGRHVNEEGVKLKAELFAEYLIKNKLIPKP